MERRPALAIAAREVGLLQYRRGHSLPLVPGGQHHAGLGEVSASQPQGGMAKAIQGQGRCK